jgi:hypothetical protein
MIFYSDSRGMRVEGRRVEDGVDEGGGMLARALKT